MARGRRNGGWARKKRPQGRQACTLTSTARTTGWSRSISTATRVTSQTRGAEQWQCEHVTDGRLHLTWRIVQGFVRTTDWLASTDEGPRPATTGPSQRQFRTVLISAEIVQADRRESSGA